MFYCITYLANGGSKLHRAAHTLKMLSAIGSIGIRKFPCRILKSFRRPTARSTWIRMLPMARVDFTAFLESCLPEEKKKKKRKQCKYSKFQLEKLQMANCLLWKENSEQSLCTHCFQFSHCCKPDCHMDTIWIPFTLPFPTKGIISGTTPPPQPLFRNLQFCLGHSSKVLFYGKWHFDSVVD